MAPALRNLSLFPEAIPVLPPVLPLGFSLFRALHSPAEQVAILDEVAGILGEAPAYRPRMKMGAYIINHISNCGSWGWHADERGYAYVERHPETGRRWPEIPPRLMHAAVEAAKVAGCSDFVPDACLINIYAADGKLNLHQDHDETDYSWPVVSFSLGNDCIFVAGGKKRRDAVCAVRLSSGDVLVMHGEGRMNFHGVRRIVAMTSPVAHDVLPIGGRINLTFRRAK